MGSAVHSMGHTSHHAQDVDNGTAAQNDGECQQHPREVRCSEIEDAQEAQTDIGVPSPPHIDLLAP